MTAEQRRGRGFEKREEAAPARQRITSAAAQWGEAKKVEVRNKMEEREPKYCIRFLLFFFKQHNVDALEQTSVVCVCVYSDTNTLWLSLNPSASVGTAALFIPGHLKVSETLKPHLCPGIL